MARKRKMQQQELSLFDDAAFSDMPSMGGNAAAEGTVSEQCCASDAIDVDAVGNVTVGNSCDSVASEDCGAVALEKHDVGNVIAANAQESVRVNNMVEPVETGNVGASNEIDVVVTESTCAANVSETNVIENRVLMSRLDKRIANVSETDVVKDSEADKSVEFGALESRRGTGNRIIDEKLRMRAKRQRLKIAFADGTVLCHASATETMIQAICKIGVERVAALGMMSCHVPLVATSVVERYAPWTKPITEGWYLMAQGDTQQKYMQMKSIITQLGVDAHIEIGDTTTLVACDTTKNAVHKKKSQLSVTFPDGYTECSRDHQKVFVAAIEHIGFDKVKNTGLQFSGKRIVTPAMKYTCQMQMPNGEWLTVPVQAKDKYKMLRIISSMTRTPLTVRIEE